MTYTLTYLICDGNLYLCKCAYIDIHQLQVCV